MAKKRIVARLFRVRARRVVKCLHCGSSLKPYDQMLYVYAENEGGAIWSAQLVDHEDCGGMSPLDYELGNNGLLPEVDFESDVGAASDISAELIERFDSVVEEDWCDEALPWGTPDAPPCIGEFFEKYGGRLTFDRYGIINEPKE